MDSQNNGDDEQKELFEQYFEQNVLPLIKQENKLKDKYKSNFWVSLWILIFVNSTNALIVLYNVLKNGKAVSFQQILLIAVASLFILFIPYIKYKKIQRPNIFGQFLNFYKGWQCSDLKSYDCVFPSCVTDNYPFYEKVFESQGIYDDVKIKIIDLKFGKKNNFKITKSYGVYLSFEFKNVANSEIFLQDKEGFFAASKLFDLSRIKRDEIPASKYFNMYADDEGNAKEILNSSFFENVFDLKEVMRAKKLKMHIKGNKIEFFMPRTAFYFETIGFFTRMIDNHKFLATHKKVEQCFLFASFAQLFMEK